MSDAELQKAKNQTAASFYMSLDSIFYRGMLLGRTATVANWTLLKEFIPKMQQVTAEDVRRVAKKYLVPDKLHRGHPGAGENRQTQGGALPPHRRNQVGETVFPFWEDVGPLFNRYLIRITFHAS